MAVLRGTWGSPAQGMRCFEHRQPNRFARRLSRSYDLKSPIAWSRCSTEITAHAIMLDDASDA